VLGDKVPYAMCLIPQGKTGNFDELNNSFADCQLPF
jgi:hypothetical protein